VTKFVQIFRRAIKHLREKQITEVAELLHHEAFVYTHSLPMEET